MQQTLPYWVCVEIYGGLLFFYKECEPCREKPWPSEPRPSGILGGGFSGLRPSTPSFSKMLCRWFLTVCSLMNIFSAISLFLKPWATSATISRSRWLSAEHLGSRVSGGAGGEIASRKPRRWQKLAGDSRGGVGIEPDLSGVDLTDTLHEQFRCSLLQNNSGGSQLHRLDEFVFIVGSGENNHASFVSGHLKALQRGDS